MLKKIFFKFLLCLAELSLASIDYRRCRFPSNYVLRKPSEKDKTLPAIIQLEKFIVDNTANLYFKFNEELKSTCDAVIKELASLHNGNRAVQHLKNTISKYEKKYLPCKTLHREEDMISTYEKVIDSYFGRPEYFKNENAKLVAKVLDKHNAFNVTNDFNKEIEKFNMKFEQKFEELKQAIKQENKELSEDLNDWYKEDYKAFKDPFNKFAIVLDLLFDYWFVEYDEDTDVDRSAINYVLF